MLLRTGGAADDLVATLNRHRLLLLLLLRKTAADNLPAIEREVTSSIRHVEEFVQLERRARRALEDLLLIEPVASNMQPGRYRSEVERIARTGLGLPPPTPGATMAVSPTGARIATPPDHGETS
ncbi:MAG: hypothetical protein BGO50_01340 [Rhodanobacter sp. 67-28]|nr:MAG: hypothetical protein BGO50_01340 [Rhodanobacter sp. 67-28]